MPRIARGHVIGVAKWLKSEQSALKVLRMQQTAENSKFESPFVRKRVCVTFQQKKGL